MNYLYYELFHIIKSFLKENIQTTVSFMQNWYYYKTSNPLENFKTQISEANKKHSNKILFGKYNFLKDIFKVKQTRKPALHNYVAVKAKCSHLIIDVSLFNTIRYNFIFFLFNNIIFRFICAFSFKICEYNE